MQHQNSTAPDFMTKITSKLQNSGKLQKHRLNAITKTHDMNTPVD